MSSEDGRNIVNMIINMRTTDNVLNNVNRYGICLVPLCKWPLGEVSEIELFDRNELRTLWKVGSYFRVYYSQTTRRYQANEFHQLLFRNSDIITK